jgi:hypothetical protein
MDRSENFDPAFPHAIFDYRGDPPQRADGNCA